MKPMTYAGTGVDYDAMDPFKRMAQLAGRATAGNIERFGYREVEASRGESVYLVETPYGYLAHVEEGLGTKNIVADAMFELTGRSFDGAVAQDTVAMIVNDMATLGALPISIAMHFAAGHKDVFANEVRLQALVDGWRKACDLARCVWGGGETPTLRDIVLPGTAVLAGSAMGHVAPKDRLLSTQLIQPGDAIVFLASSGIHANGLTAARDIAALLPKGYLTPLSDGRAYGEALLDPTHIYVGIVEDCLDAGVALRYGVNVTGHGWRKLMRATQPFTYVIEEVPSPPAVFAEFLKPGRMDLREAYGNLNMGAGFALYLPEEDVDKVVRLCGERHPFRAFRAGHIEDGPKKVVIPSLGLEYLGDTLAVR
jgi:phosphoribosylformylglycinamidine cyclo-ligase